MKLFKKLIALILLMGFSYNAQDNKGYLSNFVSNLTNGISTDIATVFDYVNNPYGSKIRSDYCALIDFAAEFDLQTLVGLNNSELFFEMIGVNGGLPTESLGALQCLSNVEAPSMIRIYEAWFKQNFLNDDLYLLFGLRDFNSSFDVIQNASLFVNSSHGLGCEISQTGNCGPSTYPYTGLGLEVGAKPLELLEWKGIVLEESSGRYEVGNWEPKFFNESSGLLIASELSFQFNNRKRINSEDKRKRRLKRGRGFHRGGRFNRNRKFLNRNNLGSDCFSSIKLGGWYYTSEFEDAYQKIIGNTDLMHNSNFGLYLSFENLRRFNSNTEKYWGSFVRLGFANPDINNVHFYLGAGLTLSNPFNLGAENQIGISAAFIFTGSKFRNGMRAIGLNADNYEAVIELTYRLQLLDMLMIQPDFQYVINPGALKSNRNEAVLILRTEILI